MRYGILGPLRVGAATEDAVINAGRDRTVLAMLLLSAGRPVTLDQIVDAVWDDDPPVTARGQVQSCVSRLRKALAAAGVPDALVTHPVGYLLDVAPDELDATEFERLVGQARAAAADGSLDAASEYYRAAVALCRGPVLAGIDSVAVRRGASAWDERLSAVIEDRIDVELRLGHERELIGELTELVERHPLRERLRGQLMVALCRAGRQAEALSTFRQGRKVLAEELGIEPGPLLQGLHQRILAGDSELTAPDETADAQAQVPPALVSLPPPARCLPRPVADFTGRAESVDYLVAGARGAGAGPVIQLIDGMAGSGKTALAVHVAHLLAEDYPDAQLFVDLYGHGERHPLEPDAALVTLLRQLGVPSERIPSELDDRVALWRSELATRRALVVLDNAAGSAQVAPLLPTSAGTVALVTSRRRLLGLDGVRPRSLPVLDRAEAVELLGRVAGVARVAAEPHAAAEVVRRCGCLPLAIRLAGARLAHRPGWRVADLAERLAGDRPLLPELAAEDRTVAGAFELSYAPLSPPQQRMFRLLGLHPGEWLDDHAAAALADMSLSQAQDLLADLVNRHLAEEPEAGRFRLHDLIREYAAALAAADADEGVVAPLRRLLDYYMYGVRAAGVDLETAIRRSIAAAGQPLRPDLVAGPGQLGVGWLERERPNLTRSVRAALDRGLYRQGWQLAQSCFRFLSLRGYSDDLFDTQRRGLESAEAAGDRNAMGLMRNYLAGAHFRLGRLSEAVTHARIAVALHEQDGQREHAAVSRANLAVVYAWLGRYGQADAECARAEDLLRGRPDIDRAAHVIQTRAELDRLSHRWEAALHSCRQYLRLARHNGSLPTLASAIGNIGDVRLHLGHLGPAERLLTTGRVMQRRLANPHGEAEIIDSLAVLHRKLGRYGEALTLHREALLAMREVGHRYGECAALNKFGHTLRAVGDVAHAVELHRRAAEMAEHFDYLHHRADAYDGLARCLVGGDDEAARFWWDRALALYRQMDVPQRYEVAERLHQLAELNVDPLHPSVEPRVRHRSTEGLPIVGELQGDAEVLLLE